MVASPEATRARFLVLLRRALDGWHEKAVGDFSAANAGRELASLQSDDVYSQFGLASNGYVVVRLMGRMSISIGRRLGELYDSLPKYVAAARFGLEPADVAAKIAGLNLDVCVPFRLLTAEDVKLVTVATESATGVPFDPAWQGLGIEIRYNFNPNDSSRLRKDVAMAQGLTAQGLMPIYLVFSGISPRSEAIARLRRAGWTFLIAEPAANFTKALLGLDLTSLLAADEVQAEISHGTERLMQVIFRSAALAAAIGDHGVGSGADLT